MSTAAVKIKVTIAQPFVVAGAPFSLTTTIENAHEDVIDILEFAYHIPYQVQWILDVSYSKEFEQMRSVPWYIAPFHESSWKKAAQPPGAEMLFSNVQDMNQPLMSVLPTESTSYSFKAIVSKWLFVSGGELVFPGRIKYRYKDAIHCAPFDVRFTLRPPLVANGIGAIVGSLLGSSARSLKEQGSAFFHNLGIEFLPAMVLAGILAVIAVIYSSRRTSESQPILTVEDFWGGLIVGFMIGYVGQEFFQKFVPIR